MGQGLYRCAGWGCLNPPPFREDLSKPPYISDLLHTCYEAKPDYLMIPVAIDDEHLQECWNLPPLPDGLPHIKPRTAVAVPHCQWWPDIGTPGKGIWVCNRIENTWNLIRDVLQKRGLNLPKGCPLFVCDWH